LSGIASREDQKVEKRKNNNREFYGVDLVTMRILKILAGIILLGGAAWTTVRTYKGRGKSSWVILLFAMFLVTLGLYFLVDAVGAYWRDFRIGSEWIK
jgi:uncharacterized membrane protein YhaH (DUF805 family)